MSATKTSNRVLEAKRQLAERELARRRLLKFTTLTHPAYSPGWVHEDICARLEKFSREVAEGKSPRLMLLMPPRHGKRLADSTPVFTPQGWRAHGDLRAGDLVFHPSGAQIKVLSVNEPSPVDRLVTFFNGEQIKAHAEHEWTVFDRSNDTYRTVETQYLESQALTSGNRARFQLPQIEAIRTEHAALSIDPYFLGAWLGDGKSSEPVICGTEQDLNHIIARSPYDLGARYVHPGTGVHYQTFVGGIRKLIREAGLLNNKHIPPEYLVASTVQRRALLAGLVDTDGSVEPRTQRVRFRTGDERLAEQVACLVRTFGYRASIDYTPVDTREREISGGPSWCVQWTPHDGKGGGTMPRKIVDRSRKRRAVGIKSIELCAPELGRCIQVDSPDGLYLAGKYMTPTHNSELASIRFPAWHLGHHPTHEVINVGYNHELPMRFSRKVREVLREPIYVKIFPDTKLSPDSQGVEAWNTTKGGGFTAAGVGGGITGKGAHILIIDDPIKNQEEADSAQTREKLEDWYQSTAYTRLAPGGGVLLIETWWNDDDLAGRLQQAMLRSPDADQFDVVRYPALSEQWEYRDEDTFNIHRFPEEIEDLSAPPLGLSKNLTLLRPKDFCLHEERYPTDALKRIRANMQPRIWSALYQQNPVPDEGMYFRRDYFQYRTQMPSVVGKRVYTAWDFAISTKTHNDWTVGATIMQDENDDLFVMDVYRFKGDTFEIVEAMLDIATRWSAMPGVSYMLGAEDGQIWRTLEPMLKKRMAERRLYPALEVLRPLTDKMARARPLQGRMQQGKVIFPKLAPWLGTAEQEMLRFPAGAHDDIVDALSWAVQLCIGKEPPKLNPHRQPSSWKDKLDALLYGSGGSHMSA